MQKNQVNKNGRICAVIWVYIPSTAKVADEFGLKPIDANRRSNVSRWKCNLECRVLSEMLLNLENKEMGL